MEELMASLKREIIEALNLKHLKPEDIGNDQPLFGDGVGLDSIDAELQHPDFRSAGWPEDIPVCTDHC
jgi:hypothetical protein